MTLEEAIKYQREKAEALNNDVVKLKKSAEYENQVAEWLEELKSRREDKWFGIGDDTNES